MCIIKKLIPLFLLTALTFSISLPVYAAAYSKTDLSTLDVPAVHVSSASGKAGENVTLTVSFLNNPGLSSYGISMQYDPSKLTYVSSAAGEVLPSLFGTVIRPGNEIFFNSFEFSGLYVGGEVLFTVTFMINADVKDNVIEGDAIRFFYRSILLEGFEIPTDGGITIYPPITQPRIEVEPSICEHDYIGAVTTPPTCKDEGVRTYTCSKCSDSYTEPIAKNPANHTGGTYEQVITPATPVAEGLMGIYCAGCDALLDTRTIPIEICDHNYTGVVTTPATCAAEGVRTFTCSKCADYYTEPIAKNPASHTSGTYEQVITQATPVAEGLMGIYCAGCDALRSTRPIDKLTPPPGNITVNSVPIPVEVVNGVAVLKPTKEQMASILAAPGNTVIFDLSGFSSVDVRVSASVFGNTDKTIVFITDNGRSEVKTKSLWNNSGKDRLITIRNNKLEVKNL